MLFALSALLASGPVPAAGAAGVEQSAPQYRAPSENPVPRRIGGSSRGVPPALPSVAALVPDHLGLTVSEQPTLYWYLSAPTGAHIEITLIQPGLETPVLDVTAAGTSAGIQSLDLSRHNVRLRAGVEYEWSVALVPDSAQRSRDIVSGGAIMRIDRPATTSVTAEAYAAQGLWYDTLMALEQSTLERPTDPTPRGQRAVLLEQAGLAEVASFERR